MLRQFASFFRPSRLCLVADGSAVIRSAVSSILQDMRFQVAEAETGPGLFKAWREHKPDAVLVDGLIAKPDGFSFLRALASGAGHDDGQRTKIILCTAERNPQEIAMAIDAGADEYLVKPFDRTVLRAKFQQLGLAG